MQQIFLFVTGLTGALAVALGAVGAHLLKDLLTPEQMPIFEKAVLYHFFHCIAMLAVIALMAKLKTRALIAAGFSFIAGILLFSGSLYLISTKELLGITDWTFLGPLTPAGGFFFITGWIMIGVSAFRT